MHRHFPEYKNENLLTRLELSRIEQTRAYMSTTETSPFHPVVNENVRYSTNPLIIKRNRVLSKYENNNPGNTNIALYDTRNSYDVEATNIMYNKYHNDLMNRANSKVLLATDYLKPAIINDNGVIEYNPNIKNSNKCDIEPQLLDTRMLSHGIDRPYMFPSEQANMAIDLQNSEWMKEKWRRNQEAIDSLHNHQHKDRWVEDKMAYGNRMRVPIYENVSLKNRNRDTSIDSAIREQYLFDENKRTGMFDVISDGVNEIVKRIKKIIKNDRHEFDDDSIPQDYHDYSYTNENDLKCRQIKNVKYNRPLYNENNSDLFYGEYNTGYINNKVKYINGKLMLLQRDMFNPDDEYITVLDVNPTDFSNGITDDNFLKYYNFIDKHPELRRRIRISNEKHIIDDDYIDNDFIEHSGQKYNEIHNRFDDQQYSNNIKLINHQINNVDSLNKRIANTDLSTEIQNIKPLMSKQFHQENTTNTNRPRISGILRGRFDNVK